MLEFLHSYFYHCFRVLAHAWELVVLNRNRGLMRKNEQSVEGSHSENRNNRSDLARKTDLFSNLLDTFARKQAASDVGVRSRDRKVSF